MVNGGIYQVRLIGQYTGFEVASACALHPEASTGKVGRSDIGHLEIEDDYLEVDTGAENALQTGEEDRIAVEVLAEVRPRLLGVDEAHLPALRRVG